jgi:hypothetical protein
MNAYWDGYRCVAYQFNSNGCPANYQWSGQTCCPYNTNWNGSYCQHNNLNQQPGGYNNRPVSTQYTFMCQNGGYFSPVYHACLYPTNVVATPGYACFQFRTTYVAPEAVGVSYQYACFLTYGAYGQGQMYYYQHTGWVDFNSRGWNNTFIYR